MTDEKINNFYFLYSLGKIPGIGIVKIKNITEKIKTLSAFDENVFENYKIQNEANNIFAGIQSGRFSDEFLILLEKCKESNINITTIIDDDYPINLKNIYDPPIILYYKGHLSEKDRYSLAIVGTRYPSDYGGYVCRKIAGELSDLNIPVISGMAMGIDYTAHKICLEKENLTYAVLGNGVDVLYPQSSKYIYDKIIEKGAVLSEYAPGTKPEKTNFPRRNRIISGISLGVVIVESDIRGGSLITAEYAIDQNRELFAVPGNINSIRSTGCNELIKKNYAKLVSNSDDILMELNISIPEEFILKKQSNIKTLTELSVFEERILNILNKEDPLHIDEISEQTGINVSDCLVNLLELEFKGYIIQLPGKNFIRNV